LIVKTHTDDVHNQKTNNKQKVPPEVLNMHFKRIGSSRLEDIWRLPTQGRGAMTKSRNPLIPWIFASEYPTVLKVHNTPYTSTPPSKAGFMMTTLKRFQHPENPKDFLDIHYLTPPTPSGQAIPAPSYSPLAYTSQ
jgi:hypothetical protein